MKKAKDYLDHWLSCHSGVIGPSDADELRSIFMVQEKGASCAERPPQDTAETGSTAYNSQSPKRGE